MTKNQHCPKINRLLNRQTTMQKTLTACLSKLTALFEANDVDNTHGIVHALVIVQHGKKAIEAKGDMPEEQAEEIVLACLLHDADDRKYFKYTHDFDNARKILQEVGITQERIQRIVGMISCVSFSKNGDKIDQSKSEQWYYPRYCDRIDAIGFKGIIRCYEYNQHIKTPLFCQHTAKPRSIEQLLQVSEGRQELYIARGGTSDSFIDHIYDKLIHIKLPEYIKNPYLSHKFKEAKEEIIDFTLKHSHSNFENIQTELEAYLHRT